MGGVRFVSLFSGIGGLDLGLEMAGWECVAQVEIDPFCLEILEKHWPEVPRYGDVRELSGSTLPSCDAIVGGFPCQPVSLAGRQKGTSDERWLWPDFARLVGEIRPRLVVVENVPGLRSNGGTEVVADFTEMGYDIKWGELSAASVGAPHLRNRVFIVAYPRSDRVRAEQVSIGGGGDTSVPINDGEVESVADTYGERLTFWSEPDSDPPRSWVETSRRDNSCRCSHDVANATSTGLEMGTSIPVQTEEEPERRSSVGDTYDCKRCAGDWEWYERRWGYLGNSSWWGVEPRVGRVANGIPRRVDKLRGLGNAVVPQWAEKIGQLARELI